MTNWSLRTSALLKVLFKDDRVREAQITFLARVELVEDALVGLQVPLDLEPLGEHAAAAIELAEENGPRPLSERIVHFEFKVLRLRLDEFGLQTMLVVA